MDATAVGQFLSGAGDPPWATCSSEDGRRFVTYDGACAEGAAPHDATRTGSPTVGLNKSDVDVAQHGMVFLWL